MLLNHVRSILPWSLENNIVYFLILFRSCWDCACNHCWSFANIHFFNWLCASQYLLLSMNSHGTGRRTPKRRRTTTKSHSRLLDLNCPPAEGAGEGALPFNSMPVLHSEASSSMPVQHIQASSSMPPATDEPRIGMHSCPIDVEAIDDDVVIYSSISLPRVCTCALF